MGPALARLGLSGREALLLGTAVALAVAVRLASVALTDGHALAGDQLEYDLQGRLFADGLAWWSTTPFGELHPSLWKAPLYTANPSLALVEVPFEGRSVGATQLGLLMYYPLLGLALVALWRHRARRGLVLPVLALALAASIVYTGASGTRYRAPLEPLIVVLACSTPFVARAAGRLT